MHQSRRGIAGSLFAQSGLTEKPVEEWSFANERTTEVTLRGQVTGWGSAGVCLLTGMLRTPC